MLNGTRNILIPLAVTNLFREFIVVIRYELLQTSRPNGA